MNGTQIYQTGLLWFTNDLRLDDNLTLLRASQKSISLVCVYVIDPEWFQPNRYSLRSMGDARWKFLLDTLKDLKNALEKLNQTLLIIYDSPVKALSELILKHHIEVIYRSENAGFYENQQWKLLKRNCSGIAFESFPTSTLYSSSSLPLDICLLKDGISFTRFRKFVEPVKPDYVLEKPAYLPPTSKDINFSIPHLPKYPKYDGKSDFVGGATEGNKRIKEYFGGYLPSNYKNVRNSLDGWSNSTKFSPWLANGSISVREVFRALEEYQNNIERNESTYWIGFELLWREYFHWFSLANNKKLFSKNGIKDKNLLTSFYPERFKLWCSGCTPYPLVNACMNQLNQTGFMSNRGRQITASCLVNEFSVDWRYGAAYFEQQLIDYDVATNWGNWQYLAGAGTDPRGKRHFDIDKQTQLYDANGDFIQKWNGENDTYLLDSVDAADWPICS